jgi:hypothetical protein
MRMVVDTIQSMIFHHDFDNRVCFFVGAILYQHNVFIEPNVR